MSTETLTWTPVATRLPDDQETVLVFVPGCGEPVLLGFHDDDGWFSVDGAWIEFQVAAWSPIPRGPQG